MPRSKSSLIDILNSCKSIERFIENKTFSDFSENEILQEAVMRKIEIIGEASNRVSDIIKNEFSYLPWKKMKAMRNILIHMYDELDINIIWDTALNDIPKLKNQIEHLISCLKD